jgi:phage tail protein X
MTQGAQYIVHITKAGERWDLLAWRYYGDPTDYQTIVMANPGVAIEAVFDAGITLAVPIVQKSAVVSVDLPPWKLRHPVGV